MTKETTIAHDVVGAEKLTTFEEVKDQTTADYFRGNQFSIDAFETKYALIDKGGETYVQAVKRVCDYVASVEKTQELRDYWSKRWFHEIYNDWWHPAGSIMQGANSGRKISLANCTSTTLGTGRPDEEWDSLEGIIKNTAYTVAKSAAYRQGTGVDFSRLRPVGTRVLNSANKSTGSVHWMRFMDSIGNYVGQCLHPDTLILTTTGYKTIKEIVETKYDGFVFSLDKKARIINWFKNPKKQTYKIKTEYGDILNASSSHKVLIYDWNKQQRIEKTINEISVGDYVVCRRHDTTIYNTKIIPLNKFEYALNDHNNSNRLNIPSKTPSEMDEDLAYILGIIYGDGCAYNESIEIAFSNCWPEILEKFSKCMLNVFGISLDSYGCRVKIGAKGDNQGDCTKVILGKWFYKFFEHINCLKTKAGTLEFPEIIKISPRSVLESFFAGVFDSDGYNSMDKRNVALQLIDYDFLQDIKQEFQKYGYVIKLRIKNREPYVPAYTLSFVGTTSLKMLSEVPSIKIQEGNLFGKNDRLKTPYGARELGLDYNAFTDINGDDPLSDSKYFKYVGQICPLYVQRIEEIVCDGETETFDITVDDLSHLFAANPFIVSNSGRVPALLFSLSCKHPDVEEFIAAKSDKSKIQNANISVQCTDDFYDAVKKDKNWDLTFEIPEVKKGQKVYIDVHSSDLESKKDEKGWYYIAKNDRKKEVIKKTVKAKHLMELIAKNMHSHGEPGVQNIDIAKRYSNSDYLDDIDSSVQSTNACSEQYLGRENLCILSSVNCEKFSIFPEELESQLSIVSTSINRFLDNVNECEIHYETYATPHQKLSIKKLRRTGAGITNIAGWLFKNKTPYGSEKSIGLMEKFVERYAYHLYKSSISLGKEKGSFELFDQEKLEKSPFIKRMKKLGLEFKTLRNVTLISIAPGGTLSLMFRDLIMSYGIEPAFGMYYWKRTRMQDKDKYKYYFNVPHVVREAFKSAGFEIPISSDTIADDWQGSKGKPILEFIEANKKNIDVEFKSASDIKCIDKLELMSRVMKWVDSSISVTYLLPEKSSWKEVYEFIMMAHEKEVKSIAAFPESKMYGIVSLVPFRDLAIKLKEEEIFIHPQNFSDEELQELSMSREDVVVKTMMAPKRQPVLDAEIYSIKVKNEKFIIVIGLQNGYPYEVFGGKMNGLKIDMEYKHLPGKISKVKRGVYSLEFEETVIKDFSKQFTPVEKILFRSLSLMLRHGIPVIYIVDQLNKASEDMFSLAAATCRVLKKYIRDGQKVTGRTCPQCGSTELVYQNGCVMCLSCNHSACN